MGYSISCFYILFLFIIVINHGSCVSDLRACANEDCSEILSYAKTILTYMSDNDYSLSFQKNMDVIVYSKSAGSDTSLWGVSIKGVRGYAPKKFLKETKKVGKIRFEVPTEYYEVVNNELVRKKNKPKSKNEVFDEKKNLQNSSSDNNNIVLGSEENNNTDAPRAEHTEELIKTQETFNEPALFSGVSGKTIDSTINATPSYVVIDGTTLPPSLDEDEAEGSLDDGVEENYEEELSGSGEQINETEPVASNQNEDIPKSETVSQQENNTSESIQSDSNNVPSEPLDPAVDVLKNYSTETPQTSHTETPQTPQIVQKVEEEKQQISAGSDIVKPIETQPPLINIPEVAPVQVDPVPLEPVTDQENLQSSKVDQVPDVTEPKQDTIIPSADNLVSNESLNTKVTDIPPANESTISEEKSNPVPDAVDVSNNNAEVVMPPVNNIETIKEEPVVPNHVEDSYLIPPSSVPEVIVDSPNKEENIIHSPETINNIYEIYNNDKVVSPDTIVSSSTESPSSFTTISGSDYEIPLTPETESTFTDQYASSTIPSIEKPTTTDIPPIYQNISPDLDINNNDQSVFDFTVESSSIKYEEPISDFDQLFGADKQPIESITEPDKEFRNDEPLENEESFVSNIFKSFSSVTDQVLSMFKSGDKVEEEMKPQWREEKLSDDEDRIVVGWEAFIASFLPAYSALPQCRPEENVIAMTEVSTDMVMWLIISAVSVLAFTLGYYFLENRKQDGKLLAMVNSLQKELLCSSKECIILKDELTITKEKLIGIEDSSFGSDEMVACLKKEIADAQHTISDLQDRLTQSEEELANSTEAALELQTILDDQLSSKDTSNSSLTYTVSNLQAQLDEQQTTMNLTKGQLAAKVEENELLMAKMVEVGNKTATIERELLDSQKQLRQAREECENKSQQLHELSTTMEKSLQELKDQKAAEVKDLQSQLKNCKGELESSKVLLKARAHEVASLQENLKLLKIDGTNIDALIDVSHTKAELTQVTTEKSILAEKLEKEHSQLLEFTNKVEVQENQMKQMRDQLNEAEQKSIQATSRLDVLTNYFNQKEAELIKELSTKEALWLSQQGENMSTIEKIQSLQQEIQQYKETTESVRRELAEQEAAWRARNAALERKAHEQWLARRAAERQAEAASSEAQSLRQRLAAPSPTDKPQGMVSPLNSVEGIGDLPLLPPPNLPFPPFPPLGGLPPPPFLPPPLPPHRPPPLGRLSSPPPLPPQLMRHDRYSPDSRYNTDRERDYSPDRRSIPQNRGRSPYSQDGRRRQYNMPRRYDDDDRYYDSGEDRRSHRRYDETETDFSPPPSPPRRRAGPRNHKGVSSGSGQSSESLERISKHSNKY